MIGIIRFFIAFLFILLGVYITITGLSLTTFGITAFMLWIASK